MKILVYEFFLAGLWRDDPRRWSEAFVESAAVEGMAMLRAAFSDLLRAGVEAWSIIHEDFGEAVGSLSGVEVVSSRYGSTMKIIEDAIEASGAVMTIAPEIGGRLGDLVSLAESRGKAILGSSAQAIRAAGDKLLFAGIMDRHKIPHPRTFPLNGAGARFKGAWVSKPRRGAGSSGIVKHHGDAAAPDAADPVCGELIAQELVEGETMSLSVVSSEKESVILSVNRQALSENHEYTGGTILDVEPWPELADMARRLKEAIPGLNGYWGADYLQTAAGPVVIEVNPRLTTSYAALSRALDVNPAEAILAAAFQRPLPAVSGRREIVFRRDGGLLES
ncbi:MAG: ATP-grasp domain-containing protein [Candidatus Nitrospinota bacterium M3_3B_026]